MYALTFWKAFWFCAAAAGFGVFVNKVEAKKQEKQSDSTER